jgi:hypothetical protein
MYLAVFNSTARYWVILQDVLQAGHGHVLPDEDQPNTVQQRMAESLPAITAAQNLPAIDLSAICCPC